MGRLPRSLLISLAIALMAGPASLASTAQVTVELNDSKPIGLYGTAANVIVGDPLVADVTLVDSHTLIVNGRGYGRTHIMVMDSNGRTLLDTHVSVVAPTDGRVTLYRGAAATNYTCSPRCESLGGASNAAAASNPASAVAAGLTPQSSSN